MKFTTVTPMVERALSVTDSKSVLRVKMVSAKALRKSPGLNLQNYVKNRRAGHRVGVGGRLKANPTRKITIPTLGMGNILKINRGEKTMFSFTDGSDLLGDRLSLPASQPNAANKTKYGARGRISLKLPTTVAPRYRACYAGGGVDSVPTVTEFTPGQSRISTMMTKKRMANKAGVNINIPSNRPRLYTSYHTSNTVAGARNGDSSSSNAKDSAQGNMHSSKHSTNFTAILEPFNQDDTDVTSYAPNPMDPLPPNNPIEQQGNQYSNMGAIPYVPHFSKNFVHLEGKRGRMERKPNQHSQLDGNVPQNQQLFQ